ncbi:hypothetical protein MRX96_029427 [Rhipicephalus microplus]
MARLRKNARGAARFRIENAGESRGGSSPVSPAGARCHDCGEQKASTEAVWQAQDVIRNERRVACWQYSICAQGRLREDHAESSSGKKLALHSHGVTTGDLLEPGASDAAGSRIISNAPSVSAGCPVVTGTAASMALCRRDFA